MAIENRPDTCIVARNPGPSAIPSGATMMLRWVSHDDWEGYEVFMCTIDDNRTTPPPIHDSH